MKWKQYQKEAFQTNANLGEGLDTIHMLLGMSTEIGELQDAFKKKIAYGKKIDWKNVKEEVGDLFWYIAGLAEFKGWYMDEFVHTPVTDYEIEMIDKTDVNTMLLGLTCQVSDLIAETSRLSLASLIAGVVFTCHKLEFDVERILENNIEKLRERYPNSFTKYDALNRNLKVESEVLDE